MLKKVSQFLLVSLFGLGVCFSTVHASSSAVDEKNGTPIVAYGDTLSVSQKEETKKLLGVAQNDSVDELTVSGQDLVKYITDGNPDSHMYSSAKITRKASGTGIQVNIVTPDNITEVTDSMYANALLTAGVQNAEVEVASPVKVTGHSALVGIYKAYDKAGSNLNADRTDVANKELELATDLSKKEGMDQDKVTQLLTDIKQEIAKQHPATKQDIADIVDSKLKSLNITLSDSDRQALINLFNKMRGLNINFDNVKSQLGSITKDLKDRIHQAASDTGFWKKVANFFASIFQAIANFFSGLFS